MTASGVKAPPSRGRTAPGRAPAKRPVSLLGQWASPVTSYYLLVGATALLLLIGLIMVLSSSSVTAVARGDSPYSVFINQARFALIGLPALLLAAACPPRWFKPLSWLLMFAALILQTAVFLPGIGHGEGGNFSWLTIGPITMQPAELAKLALALWLATVLSRKQEFLDKPIHVIVPGGLGALASLSLVLAGRDVGTALIVMMVIAGAFFMAGLSMRWFAAAGLGVVLLLIGLVQSSPSRMARVGFFLSGEDDPQNVGYQVKHGLRALGTGGWGGTGLGASREKWQYLPEAHNDFIFAIIGEELGIIGTVMVLFLFVMLGLAIYRILVRSTDPFVRIATSAIGVWIIGQALLNIAVVVGLLPVFGVPLPLVSAGGSALVVTMAAIGVLISFARNEPGAKEALATRGLRARRSVSVVWRSASTPQSRS